jgi:ribosome-associated toxin RatA of RatAB toxin-antitoxin module
MKTVQQSVLIWYSAQEMFALVADVARYPRFLPWCDHALVLAQDEGGMTAEVGIAMGGIRQRFTTRNDHLPGPRIAMRMLDGPFSRLDGEWTFTSLADAVPATGQPVVETRACRVGLRLHYGFGNAALARLVGPVFGKISEQLVDAFVKRAEQVYG